MAKKNQKKVVVKSKKELGQSDFKKKKKDLKDIFDFKATKKNYNEETNELRYSCTRITQHDQTFYTATIPSDVLASTCFVTDRYDDPVEGFQRRLDKEKAEEIAKYIDEKKGTIPTSVILSAQDASELWVDQRKTLVFQAKKKSFMVLDGQHRIYGYYLAKSVIDVPVVIYEKLKRSEEARLFIDINSKQTKVSSSLLLDIKSLADEETDEEIFMGEVFNLFRDKMESALLGLVDSAGQDASKINRTAFNRALKPLLKDFIKPSEKTPEDVYDLLNPYISAVFHVTTIDYRSLILRSNYLYGILNVLPDVVKEVKYKFNKEFTTQNFLSVIKDGFESIKPALLKAVSGSGVKVRDLLAERVRSQGSDW